MSVQSGKKFNHLHDLKKVNPLLNEKKVHPPFPATKSLPHGINVHSLRCIILNEDLDMNNES